MIISKSYNTVLITGTAGFIGFHLAKSMLENNWNVIGIDGLTNYYDVSLKQARQNILIENNNFISYKVMLEDEDDVYKIFKKHLPNIVIHLAAQAGVRYSIENPKSYLQSNIVGTFNILEMAKNFKVNHLLFASTSSAYGSNKQMPFQENQKTDTQMSFYAATKKACENMSHSYSYTHEIPITVFRFFTVYGPWGRPDMALFKFTKAILEGNQIDVYNYGKMSRDFTYISDLVEAIRLLIKVKPEIPDSRKSNFKFDSISDVAPWRLVNIGNSKSVPLIEFIQEIEKQLGKKANKNFMEIQIGDVPNTMSNVDLLMQLTNFKPNTPVSTGIEKFVSWYKYYYQKG